MNTFTVQERLRCRQPCLLTLDFDILKTCVQPGTSLVPNQILLRRFPAEDCVTGKPPTLPEETGVSRETTKFQTTFRRREV